MPLWNPWRRGSSEAVPEDARVPLPQVGEMVRLHASGNAQVGVYHARVRAVGPGRLLLDSPESTPSPEDDEFGMPPLPPRTPLTLSFVRADALFQCETRVVGPAKAGTLTVARPRLVTKIQRRQFYRLPLQSPTTFRVRGESGSSAPVAARLVNLSGGGALLASAKPVPGGLQVLVRVPTGKDAALLDVDADVLDCRVATQGRSRIYLVRLRFLGAPHLTDEERDEIVAYIFEQQRMLLRNRKLLR